MPRKNKNARRKFDTRMNWGELARKINLTPRQKVKMLRYIKKRAKGGENLYE